MSENTPENKTAPASPLQQKWTGSSGDGEASVLLPPDEFTIYIEKARGTVTIFHRKDIAYDTLDKLAYNHETRRMLFIRKNGVYEKLGAPVETPLHPYVAKAADIHLERTRDGQRIDKITLPVAHQSTDSKDRHETP